MLLLQFRNPSLQFKNSIINGFQYSVQNKLIAPSDTTKVCVTSQSATALPKDANPVFLTSANLILQFAVDKLCIQPGQVLKQLEQILRFVRQNVQFDLALPSSQKNHGPYRREDFIRAEIVDMIEVPDLVESVKQILLHE